MITREKNAGQYADLFTAANQALNITDENQKIRNINMYLAQIEQLEKTAGGDKFLVVPVDEPKFAIDANTRRITIPSDFRSGVGVVGDHLAETVFFEIDRYFDTTDLANIDNIYIEWSVGDITGASKNYLKIVYTDKIVFGWVMTDNITQMAGTVTFSVRFIETDSSSGEVTFSLGTQPASITINKTLNLDLDSVLIEDVAETMKKRLENAIIDDDNISGEPPEAPTILIPITVFPNNMNLNISDADSTPDENGSDKFRIKIQAAKTSNKISYDVYRDTTADATTIDISSASPYAQMTIVYEPTQDAEENVEKQYYIATSDGFYTEWIRTPETEGWTPTNPQLYEKFGQYDVTLPGLYAMTATATSGLQSTTASLTEASYYKFPSPIKPVFAEASVTPIPVNLDEENELVGTYEAAQSPSETFRDVVSYQWYYSAINNSDYDEVLENGNNYTLTITNPGYYELIATSSRNGADINSDPLVYRATHTPANPQIEKYGMVGKANGTVLGTLGESELELTIKLSDYTYDKIFVAWYKGSNTESFDPEVDTEVMPYAEINYETGVATYTPTLAGVYYALIKTELNTFTSEIVNSAENDPKVTWAILAS